MMYNNIQHLGRVLVFDLRSRLNFHYGHVADSLSFPLDLCDEKFFVNWDPEHVTSKLIKNKEKVNLFKSRKRLFVYIIASQNDIQQLVYTMGMVFNDMNLKMMT
jgi:hypothetical protein